MILRFKTHFRKDKPTFFYEKILAYIWDFPEILKIYKPKKHTIRKGHRWKAGTPIQMAMGGRFTPYVQFNKYEVLLQKCISTQHIQINYPKHEFTFPKIPKIFIDGDKFDYRVEEEMKVLNELAINDGFDSFEDFLEWFHEDFDGQIIHWTDLVYKKSI